MSDRHQELLRQHALLREHLAWLEQEIARDAASSPSASTSPGPQSTAGAPKPSPFNATQASAPASSPGDTDALLHNYAEAERHDPRAVQRGCLLGTIAVLGVLIAAVVSVYFLFYRHR